MVTAQLLVKSGKEKSIRQGHPWIFSGAVQRVEGQAVPGESIDICDAQGQFLARAYYNPSSSIVARIFSHQKHEDWGYPLLRQRIAQATARRAHLAKPGATMQRLVASEADLLPGLIIDRYENWVVFQILTLGMERQRAAIIEAIKAVLEPEGLIERSDEAIRSKEGLELRKEIIFGDWPDTGFVARESDLRYEVNLWEGHKTGFYLDQRANRALVGHYAENKDVLNCFAYTGGFSLAAAHGGARRVRSVEASQAALDGLERNWRLNGFEPERHESVRADVFSYLRQLRSEGAQYDLIVMDPPKFVADKRQIDKACRGYKDLNLLALQLLRPGGYLATFSCSGLLSRDLFQKVLFGAAVDARCDVQITHHLSQAEDHPVLLNFPESLYLKGLFCQKL